MEQRKLLENWAALTELLQSLSADNNNKLAKYYLQQHLEILNEILGCTVEYIDQLSKTTSPAEIFQLQATISQEISKKLMNQAQQLLSTSLENILDYNNKLKSHCDLATD